MNYQKRYKRNNYGLSLVLDLDETLIRFNEEKIPKKLESFRIDYGVIVKRPHLDEFLNKALYSYYPIFVWTAAERNYAEQICKHIFKETPEKIYARDNCNYSISGHLYKPVHKIKEDYPLVNLDRMVAVDDRESAYELGNENFVIPIKKWIAKDRDDDCLLKTLKFLDHLKTCESIEEEIQGIDWELFWENGLF